MTTFFCSDIHFGHEALLHPDMPYYLHHRKYNTIDEMDEGIIDKWNSQVTPQDTVYIIGDLSFRTTEDTVRILSQLPGQKFLIKGNHDHAKKMKPEFKAKFQAIHLYHEIKPIIDGEKQLICMFHFPIMRWNRQHYGSWHLHGHCVDLDTELLTSNGWKKRNELSVDQQIISFNTEKSCMEYDNIQSFVDLNYSGNVFSMSGKSYDFRFTEGHTMLCKKHVLAEISKMSAKDFCSRNKGVLLCSSLNTQVSGTGLPLDILRLYIILAADGNIKWETNLCRVGIKKDHKIEYLGALLSRLGIPFKRLTQKKQISFNFYLPKELLDWNIKGLDSKLLNCNKEEADAVFESYCHSDGHRNGKGVIIYSAKDYEIDLLQAMFCQNEYQTNKSSRFHGFGVNLQHQLSVYPKTELTITIKDVNTEAVEGEHFWCVKTKNQSWVMRRNGVVQITGNCHGSPTGVEGKILDVGWDNHGKLLSLEDVNEYMKTKRVRGNHHSGDM